MFMFTALHSPNLIVCFLQLKTLISNNYKESVYKCLMPSTTFVFRTNIHYPAQLQRYCYSWLLLMMH